jgi:hypothetical protein
VLRAHLTYALRNRGNDAITIAHAACIALEIHVFEQIVKTERVGAGAPLPITSDRDNERPVDCVE